MGWSSEDDADAATWTALDTNSAEDWDTAIALARAEDQRNPIPGARD